MNLLYADESGTSLGSKQVFFVLAGVSVFERQCFWINSSLDEIARRFNPSNPASVELHGSPMLNGRDQWRRFSIKERVDAIQDSLKIIANSPLSTIYACVI